MNPNAITFWLFAGGVGYLLNEWRGAMTGAVIALGVSLLFAFLPNRR